MFVFSLFGGSLAQVLIELGGGNVPGVAQCVMVRGFRVGEVGRPRPNLYVWLQSSPDAAPIAVERRADKMRLDGLLQVRSPPKIPSLYTII